MMNKKIVIKHNPYGDNRTTDVSKVSFRQFSIANSQHLVDVKQVILRLAIMLATQGKKHDWTKKKYEKEFFNDFKTLKPEDFVEGPWYQKHIHEERHHPFSYCHDDINLLDILETIVDCVCAGKARSGEIRELEFDDKIIKKAVENTVKLIDNMTELKK